MSNMENDMETYIMKANPKLTLRGRFRKFFFGLDMWIRANVTQRAHWLKLTPHASAYMDVDVKIEYALVALATDYLENELGHENKFTPKEKEGMTFYKGYQVYAVDERENIDACLRVIRAKKDEEIIYTRLGRRLSAEKKTALRTELTDALVEFVKKRGRLWT